MKITKKNLLLFLLIIISGCQQCILETQLSPKLGFDPQSRAISTNDYFSLDIIVNEIESPFFGISFQLQYDTSKIELNCEANDLNNPFFGQNHLTQIINQNAGVIQSAMTLYNGQDPVSGSGTIAVCNGMALSSGTSYIEFIPNSFYFINEFGDELLNAENTDSTYRELYYQLDSTSIIYDFELLDARIDIDHPEIIDN
jgi:hypothetical protein